MTKGLFLKTCLICGQNGILAGTSSGLGFSFTPKAVIKTVIVAITPKKAPVPLYAAVLVHPISMSIPAISVVAAPPMM
ncbi:MAG: hypothetical protein BWX81_00431 [Spirochaetes bacterium ADurb.Bin110]|nr:MAG: hypothetical protein BWX81_00431 [Spirochaetes bacterium ADurb.Bin110]